MARRTSNPIKTIEINAKQYILFLNEGVVIQPPDSPNSHAQLYKTMKSVASVRIVGLLKF